MKVFFLSAIAFRLQIVLNTYSGIRADEKKEKKRKIELNKMDFYVRWLQR